MEESTLQIRKTMQIKIGMNPFYTPLSDCIRALKKERKKKKSSSRDDKCSGSLSEAVSS